MQNPLSALKIKNLRYNGTYKGSMYNRQVK